MITRIELENFKGSRTPVVIELTPLTFLFGPNSAGKSTVIQALHYAFEVLLKGNLNAGSTARGGSVIDLGGFQSLVHGHDLGRAIRVRLDFTIDGDLVDYVTAEPVERQAVPPDARAVVVPRKRTVEGGRARGAEGGRVSGGELGGLSQAASVFVQNKLFDEATAKAGERAEEEAAKPYLSAVFAEQVSQRARRAAVEFRVRWSAVRGEPVVDRYRVRMNGKPMGCIEASSDGRGARVTQLNIDNPVFRDKQMALLEGDASPLSAVLDWDSVLSTGGGLTIGGTDGALPLRASRVRFDEPDDTGPGWRRVAAVLRLVLLGPLEVLREQLEGLRYVGPLREVLPRQYVVAASVDEGRWATGLAAWDALQRQPALRETVSEWMARPDRLGSGYGLRLRRFLAVPAEARNRYLHGDGGGSGDGAGSGSGAGLGSGAGDGEGSGSGSGAGAGVGDGTGHGSGLGEALARAPLEEKVVLLQLADGTEGLEVLPVEVGVGISQLVPIVTAAFDRQATALDGRRGPVTVVAMEQPELHVHPAIQVGIGDLLIAASKTRQLLVETHSEHVILRIQRRLRETHAEELTDVDLRVTPAEVAVVYLDRAKDGALFATALRLDEEGRFRDPWPTGFFDERMKELFS